MPAQTRTQRRRQPNRSSSTSQAATRRAPVRFVAEPIDYTLDYASVRRDLWRIALWTVVLFVGMVALYFVLR